MIRHRNDIVRDYIFWFAAVVLAALIQTNWPEMLRLQDVSPDIVIVLVVYFAIAYGEERAMFTGVIGGLYQDVAVNTTLGHHVLCYVVIGYVAGRLTTRLISEHAAVKAGMVFFAGFFQGMAYTTIQYVQQPQRGLLYPIINTAAPIAFYSAVITPFIFMIADRIFHKRTVISDGIV